jgi:hypothetical protein
VRFPEEKWVVAIPVVSLLQVLRRGSQWRVLEERIGGLAGVKERVEWVFAREVLVQVRLVVELQV